MYKIVHVDVVIGFMESTYEISESDGSVLVEVGLIGATELQREVTVSLSYSDGTATSMLLSLAVLLNYNELGNGSWR